MLNSCEAMFNDIFESNFLNCYSNLGLVNIHNNPHTISVNAFIISDQYWPKFEDNFNVKLPQIISNRLDTYKKYFEGYKVE